MTRTVATSCLLGLASLAGCSSSGKQADGGPTRADELREVGQMLTLYSGESGKGPKKAADLAKYETGTPLGYKAVKTGDVVVVWGAKMPGEGEAKSAPPDVIAYEKKTPTEGGFVLLLNGDVKEMSAADFASAPKAK